jgi:hypothetical protein
MRMLQLAPGFRAAAASAVLALAVDVVYLSVLARQGGATGSREGLVSASLAAAAAGALGASVLPSPFRPGLLAWSAGTLGSWAVLGLASIGILLAVPAALGFVALGRALDAGAVGDRRAAVVGVACALILVGAGLSVTS